MNKRQKEILTVRLVSVAFAILAFAVFQPLGMDKLGWLLYVHLLAILLLGVGVCYVSELILTYLLHKPSASDKGVDYVIHRNLWFQLINTPLMALMVCLYLHFEMSAKGLPSPLNPKGYATMLMVLAFCSFAIGLYWRFKYRSRYLAMELEEARVLNEALKKLQPKVSGQQELITSETASDIITLAGTTNENVTLCVSFLLYIEAVGNYVKVCHLIDGQVRTDMLRATSKQMEQTLQAYPMVVRCHRAYLVNIMQVEQVVSRSGTTQLMMKPNHESIPVSRSHMAAVKETVKAL